MKVGVSTACLYPMLTERSIATLIDMGVREFEVFFNTSSDNWGAHSGGDRRNGKRLVSGHGQADGQGNAGRLCVCHSAGR